MKGPKLSPQIQLSMKEYIDSWASIIYEHYQEAMSCEPIFEALSLDEAQQVQFSMEYINTLLAMANICFKSKPKITSDKNLTYIRAKMAENVYRRILLEADESLRKSCIEIFEGKYTVLEKLCNNLYNKAFTVRQKDIVALSRYMAAQFSTRSEENNMELLKQLGILMSKAVDHFMILVANSVQDTIKLDGKPSFSVQKTWD